MSKQDEPEDFAALLLEYEQKEPKKNRRGPQVGETVRGRVLSIGREAIFLDLGFKSEAMLDIGEVRDEDGKLTVAVGDEIEARVVDTQGGSGMIVLRRVLKRGPEARAELLQAHMLAIPIEGLVSSVNKGGVEVQVAGLRAFCPISQLDLRHVEDASKYVGERFTFRITRYEAGGPRGPNIVLSRRVLLEEEARARAVETRARLTVGAVLRGTVSTLKDYGAFVDLGGIEGMLHVSEIGFSRVAHPREVLTVGQNLEVQVKKIEKGDDPERPRISLSLKSLERDPWSDVTERFPEGTRCKGSVVRVESFGAFVEISPGVEGLLHVSELATGRKVNHARERTKVGQALEVTILAVDVEKRRLSLSLAGSAEPDDDMPMPTTPSQKQGFGTLGDLLNRSVRKS
ncbi:MAG: S1 RNA-binding domain-containing protein [Deltaproteobacteria bacterium]|nr:S1 RNA-binding domain-containing protein [Deltaproteobacteria bacterium]